MTHPAAPQPTRSQPARQPPGVTFSWGFDAFFEAEYPGLVGVAAALAGRADSEDLVQDAMLKALVRWERVSRLDRPGAWCHHVLINACRSLFQRRRVRQEHLARMRREVRQAPGPSEEALDFWAAVRRLPERPRNVVALFYAGDRTTAEIAAILHVPEGTVRSDLSRARHYLIRELEVNP